MLERFGLPLAPFVLGLMPGGEAEHTFLQCITKDASASEFLKGPISIGPAIMCLGLWAAPLVFATVKSLRQ